MPNAGSVEYEFQSYSETVEVTQRVYYNDEAEISYVEDTFTIFMENRAPEVSLSYISTEHAALQYEFTMSATDADGSIVSRAWTLWRFDGGWVEVDSGTGITWSTWLTVSGDYRVRARAVDNGGAVTDSIVEFTATMPTGEGGGEVIIVYRSGYSVEIPPQGTHGFYSATAGDIITRTLRLLGDAASWDADTAGVLHTRAELLDQLNQTILSVAEQTGCLKANFTIPIVADQELYEFPTDCLKPLRMSVGKPQYGGKLLVHQSIQGLDVQGLSLATAGTPGWVASHDYLDPNHFKLWMRPNYSSVEGDNADGVYITYCRYPALLELEADYPDPDLPDWFHAFLPYGLALRVFTAKENPIKVQLLQAVWRFGLEALSEATSRLGGLGRRGAAA